MEELDKLMNDKNKLLVTAGIFHGSRAFVGPEVLHIDLTNNCNFNCLACWCRSPLLGDKSMPDWERKLSLSFNTVKSIFDDLAEIGGLRQVKLVGGGEPFMHPDILKIIEYIKNKDRNIEIDINTNFSLVDEKVASRLVELGVDSLTVSLWAGTPSVYAAVHPNQKESTFEKVRNSLELIAKIKKENNFFHPRVTFHNVIFNLNYKDIIQMIDFALQVNADAIQFVPVDTVREKTESLLLSDDQRKGLLNLLYEINNSFDIESSQYRSSRGNVFLPDFSGFIKRVERLNVSTGVYDEQIIDKFPCYVGWLFARVMATGNVVPCCKGHRMSMGNVNEKRFKDIWFSEDYCKFRSNGLKLTKTDPYFSKIGNDAEAKTGCYNCDNLWQNIPMHKRITHLEKQPFLSKFSASLLKSLFK